MSRSLLAAGGRDHQGLNQGTLNDGGPEAASDSESAARNTVAAYGVRVVMISAARTLNPDPLFPALSVAVKEGGER